MIERIDGSIDTYKTKYSYYMDEKYHNSIIVDDGYIIDNYGMRTKNLLKQITFPTLGWERFPYEFDSKGRIVKKLKIKMNYYEYRNHSGYTYIDSVSSTYKWEYEY